MKKQKKCHLEYRHEKMGETSECCIMCNAKIGLSYKEKLKIKTDKISIQTKQKLLDELHKGKTIGEARKVAGIDDLAVVGEIIMYNILNHNSLRKKAI